VRRAILLAALALAAACKATPPSGLERAVATRVKRLTVGGKRDRNPLPATAENVARGRRDFSHYCVVCHGLDGQNTGVPFAGAMSPPVPLLTSVEVQGYSDGQLKSVIENGLFPSGMPGARGILGEEEMWRIVLYLRHLPPAGSLGEPPVYASDGTSR
jgi:mono/diheme cytochrome c family protein